MIMSIKKRMKVLKFRLRFIKLVVIGGKWLFRAWFIKIIITGGGGNSKVQSNCIPAEEFRNYNVTTSSVDEERS